MTCFRNVEAKCTNELNYLLNQAIESMSTKVEDEAQASTLSFEEQIKSEIGDLKATVAKPFNAVEMKGVQCIVFLKAGKDVDPVAVVERLFSLIRDRSVKYIKFTRIFFPRFLNDLGFVSG